MGEAVGGVVDGDDGVGDEPFGVGPGVAVAASGGGRWSWRRWILVGTSRSTSSWCSWIVVVPALTCSEIAVLRTFDCGLWVAHVSGMPASETGDRAIPRRHPRRLSRTKACPLPTPGLQQSRKQSISANETARPFQTSIRNPFNRVSNTLSNG